MAAPSLRLNLQYVWLLADLNGDLAVDALDEAIIGANLSSPPSNPTQDDGDLDGVTTLILMTSICSTTNSACTASNSRS